MIKFSSLLLSALLLGFQLTGLEKVFELKGPLDMTGVKKVIPVNPEFNFTPDQSFTAELKYRQDAPNPDKAYSSSILACGFWRMKAANKFGTPIFNASGRENGRWKTFYSVVAPLKNSLGQWHHIAFVRDARQKRLRFYHNGKLLRELPDAQEKIFSSASAQLVIGGIFRGTVRDIILWDGVKDRFDSGPGRKSAPESVKVDPELQNSWNLLREHNLNIVPAPKKIRLTESPFPFRPAEWSVNFTDQSSAPGYAVFCERAGKPAGGRHLIEEKYNRSFKPQEYRIDFSGTEEARHILLEGADSDGLRYAWLTLAYLVDEQKRIHPASISDYPGFRGRSVYSFAPGGKAEKFFPVIEDAFRQKTNSMEISYLTDFEKWVQWPLSEWKKVNAYAAARGIRLFAYCFPKVLDLGKDFRKWIPEGYSHYYYPYKPQEGLIGYGSGAYSWSRDDLARARAEKIAQFCADTGLRGVIIHAIDHGGFENPGNWAKRTEMDRKRWGDDYASAHAHLMNLFISEIHKKSPDTLIWVIPYPYVATKDEKTLRFYRDFSKKLIKYNTMLPLREAVRDLFVSAHKAYGDAVVNTAYYPFLWNFYPSCMNAGRFAATFFLAEKDHMTYYPGSLLGTSGNPSKAIAAEYLWNPFAPGGAYLPEDKYDYSVVFESVPVIEKELLLRVAARIAGEKAAPAFARIYACKFTDKIPELPHDLLPAGTDHKQYFESLLADVRAARKIYDSAKDLVVPSGRAASRLLEDFLIRMELLTQARLHCIRAREALKRDDIATAEKEAGAGREILKQPKARIRNLYRKIEADLEIADEIQLNLAKNKFLKTIPERKIRLGFYRYSGTADIQDYIGILPETLNGAAGISCALISNLTKQNLKSFDVILFNAVADIGDSDEPWRQNLKDFVHAGGGVIFTHNAVGRFSGGLKEPLFPGICAGFLERAETPELIFSDGEKSRHVYVDHCQIKAGPAGQVICRDRFRQPVTVIGKQGKGRAVYTGEIFGVSSRGHFVNPGWSEWLRLFKLIRWSSGDNAFQWENTGGR